MFLRFVLLLVPLVWLGACAQEGSADSAGPDAGAGEAPRVDAAPAAAVEIDVAARVAQADASKGKRIYIYCQACHSLDQGGANKLGPNLYGVFGREAAKVEGFVYSEALVTAGITWDAATLDAWIERPAELVPGTTMIFAGVSDPGQRADLIAYLQSGAE